MKKSKPRKNNPISDRVTQINYSSIRKSFTAGSTQNVINATIGRPDFDVPNEIKEQAKLYIERGYNAYTETKGILPLREAISDHLKKRNVHRTANEILVTSGATSAIFMVISSLVNPDDEVVIFEPYFVAYPEIVKIVNGKCTILKTTDDFQLDTALLEKVVTKKTKLIILNSPNNPTGAVYPVETIKIIVRIAKKMGTYILSDEIYHDFIYGKTPHYSAAEIYDKTVIVDGLSKS
ncbi:MAG: aminotransferase class I/II-fold pyridoxal phosphate-dependent enzyme, partial [Patescibacteria group bacterium]